MGKPVDCQCINGINAQDRMVMSLEEIAIVKGYCPIVKLVGSLKY